MITRKTRAMEGRPLCNVPGVQRSQTIPDSSKSIFQVDTIQPGTWSEFPIGLRTFFRYASSVANERSDPRIGPGTFFRLGTVWVRAEGNGEIGP